MPISNFFTFEQPEEWVEVAKLAQGGSFSRFLSITPVAGEKWFVSSVLYDITFKYFADFTYVNTAGFKALVKAKGLYELSLNAWQNAFNKSAESSINREEIVASKEADKAALEGVERELAEYGLQQVREGLPNPFIQLGLVLRRGINGELLWTQSLSMHRNIRKYFAPVIKESGTEQKVGVIEELKNREALPVPVLLLPHETLTLSLTVNGPEPLGTAGGPSMSPPYITTNSETGGPPPVFGPVATLIINEAAIGYDGQPEGAPNA